MAETKASNITWHEGTVTRAEREKLLGQRGVTIWLTGLSGSGKSTIAVAAQGVLHERGTHAYVLDGDNVRHGLNQNLGFSPEDRTENIRRIGEVAKLFTDAGIIALTSFISPYRADRERARQASDRVVSGEAFREVHIKADLAVCESRDPKGLYVRARKGEIPDFTGISAPYEAPDAADLIVDTSEQTVEVCVAKIVSYIIENFSYS